MKLFFFLICLVCTAAAVRAQETTRVQVPPVRTIDNAKLPVQKTVSLPIRSADNAVAPGGTATAQAVPLRKSDLATAAQPTATGLQGLESKIIPDSLPPSFLSPKQAAERLQKQGGIKKPVQ